MTDSTIHALRAVMARFNAAAKKYRSTYADHRNDPCNGEALEAWDKATAEFSAMIANDELNIIAALLEALEVTENRASAFEKRASAAEKRIPELENEITVSLNEMARIIQRETKAKHIALQNIAELESRTVKLPYLPDDCDRTEAHFKYQAALTAAGIKWEDV
ncbi:hypothetical protein [Citrobacter portucalensis]|uniref:hypothetical protein n=1 Tax=Citrobacter portucalensis TaxID=1639133 RepID=UPI002244727F|nr:hypothetical protein [Citrobacter portucalensis]MCW8352402.1 hypothetical protein [Citrobacter portucalensis]MCX9042232.1 hypothetical protein [Citrobacter portucalensis]MCX9051981.1 hypothetical protein [Citrobacter portucalensis]